MKGGGGGISGNRASPRSFRDVEEGNPEITLAASSPSPSRDPRGFPVRRGGSGIRWWHVGVALLVVVNCGFIVKWDLLNASYSAATMSMKGSWMTMPEVNFTITKAPSVYGRSHHNRSDHWYDTLGGEDSSSSEQLGSSKGESRGMECTEEWLEEADAVTWAHRDFKAHPVLIIDHDNMVRITPSLPEFVIRNPEWFLCRIWESTGWRWLLLSQYVDACMDQLAHVYMSSEESWVPTETETLN